MKALYKNATLKKVWVLSYQGNWVKERNKRGHSSQEATIGRTVEFGYFAGSTLARMFHQGLGVIEVF